MGKRAQKELRAQIARELLTIGDALVREGICLDVGPLKAAANQCLACGGDHWKYDVSNLIFRLGQGINTLPSGLATLDCRLNVRVAGLCSKANASEDPMTVVEINLILEGSPQSTSKKYIQSWHFDRHITDENTPDPLTAHPRYHFHFGGRQMESFLTELRLQCFDSILLLDGPRIPHAPLDGVLIIDFILSNFLGEKWQNLRNDQSYRGIIYQSQTRNWKPFAFALTGHWPTPLSTSSWPPADVWPHLCRPQ